VRHCHLCALVLIALLSALPKSLLAQQAAHALPAPSRDPQAVGVIQNAINFLGGPGNIGQVRDCTVVAQRQATSASQSPSGKVIWEAAGSEYKSDSPAPSGRSVLASGHGNPVRMVGSVSAPITSHVLRALFVPSLVGALLLREVQDPNYSIAFVSANQGSQTTTTIKIFSVANQSDLAVTQQTWYFDSVTSSPLRVEYRFPDPGDPGRYRNTALDFSSYKSVLGVLYPFQIVMSQGGVKMADVTIQSIIINSNLSAAEFDSPASVVGPGN